MRKQRALLAGLVAMSLGGAAGVASAGPLLTLQIEGSTTGAPGTYTSTVVVGEQPGQTIYYEVNAIFHDGATNSNTANSPNGSSDSIDSLPSFQLTAGSGSTLSNAVMQNGFGNGTGSGVTQPNGTNTAVIRAVNSPGVYVNADSPLTIETGQLTLGTPEYQHLSGAYYTPAANSGLAKVSGSLTSITSTTESSADPILSYLPLTVSPDAITPEPASLGIFSLAVIGLLRRRRQSA